MTDDRDAAVRALDDELTDLIGRRLHARGDRGAGEIVEHYVIAVSITGFELAEDNSCRYAYLTRDGGYGPQAAPLHSLEGLLHRALRWITADDTP